MKHIGNRFDVAEFREILRDERVWLGIIKITSETIDQEIDIEGASYRVEAQTIPDQDPCFIYVTQGSGIESPVRKGQCWIAGFDEGNINRGFLISKISDMNSKLHPKAREENTVIRSEPEKRIFLSNNFEAEVNENIVLGQALKTWLSSLVDQIDSIAKDVESLKNTYNTHVHPAPGTPTPSISAVTTLPEQTSLDTLKSDEEIDKILSDLGFIQEKGLVV